MFRVDGSTREAVFYGVPRPISDNTVSLGKASARWTEVCAANNAINTSDGDLKKRRGALTDAELRAWAKVHPVMFQWLDSIAKKGGNAARLNVGYVAQDVAAASESEGLDPHRYARWCEDPLTDAALALSFGGVWLVNGWRLGAETEGIRRAQAEAGLSATLVPAYALPNSSNKWRMLERPQQNVKPTCAATSAGKPSQAIFCLVQCVR